MTIYTIDGQTLLIDGNSAGSLTDALINFPSITQELWVLWNMQNETLKVENLKYTNENNRLSNLDTLNQLEIIRLNAVLTQLAVDKSNAENQLLIVQGGFAEIEAENLKIPTLNATITELETQIVALQETLNPTITYIELSAPKFFVLLDHELLGGIPLSTIVNGFMATRTTNNDLRYFFEKSASFRSNDSMVLSVGALLGLSEQNIHDLFVKYQDYIVVI